jgi:uncharacterized protein YqeY
MNFKQRLQKDLTSAIRDRDERRKSALRMVLAAIQYVEVGDSGDLSDEDTLAILAKEVRRREDAIKLMQDAGRTDLVEEEIAQLEILKAYLPQQLSIEEITELAKAIIEQVGATSVSDLGSVMKNLMPQVKGKADGRTVNQVVRKLLSA